MITKKLSKCSSTTLTWLMAQCVCIVVGVAAVIATSPYPWLLLLLMPVAVSGVQSVMLALYAKGLRNGAGAREL